jgi:hypothetical protein
VFAQALSAALILTSLLGGSFDPWAGPGFAKCLALLGPEFERVFYKNNYAAAVTFFNLYMTYGFVYTHLTFVVKLMLTLHSGTNWGNLGML